MIKIGCISQINSDDYDEVWWIVRAPQTEPENEKHVPELSPSKGLFKEYRRVYHAGRFNEEYFQKVYVPLYLRELAINKQAMHILELLCKESLRKNIMLGCYCENELLCHRSVVAGILLGMGARIEIDVEYIKYFEKLKLIKDEIKIESPIKTDDYESVKEYVNENIKYLSHHKNKVIEKIQRWQN